VVLRDGRVDAELEGEELTNQNLLATLVGTDTNTSGTQEHSDADDAEREQV
jgi:ribose transport system ATP-binding protein